MRSITLTIIIPLYYWSYVRNTVLVFSRFGTRSGKRYFQGMEKYLVESMKVIEMAARSGSLPSVTFKILLERSDCTSWRYGLPVWAERTYSLERNRLISALGMKEEKSGCCKGAEGGDLSELLLPFCKRSFAVGESVHLTDELKIEYLA